MLSGWECGFPSFGVYNEFSGLSLDLKLHNEQERHAEAQKTSWCAGELRKPNRLNDGFVLEEAVWHNVLGLLFFFFLSRSE